MAERQQLRRQQALERRGRARRRTSPRWCARSGSAAEREGLLRACGRRARPRRRSFGIGREPAAELDLPSGRRAPAGAEARCPSSAPRCGGLGELAAQAAAARRAARARARDRHLARAARATLQRLLAQLAPRRPRAACSASPRAVAPGVAARPRARPAPRPRAPQLLLAALEVPQVEQVAARQQALLAQQRQHVLAEQQRAEAGLHLVELASRARRCSSSG